ncbi:glucosamine-6-phosphate deaminase [Burkholderia sp. Ac-20353]|uniref:glucosamine-6-phosphate deaminase n=1 Tax=Burkholderia sp. Ac-20353 TaxID=2703894 RepID=UPI00197B8992|nr:glucosamine-6-phosphate deaminase [Burkholderia sp. Ac-20353]MBN3785954.1 glucosamine-6-phosphate deaminase [Burkholderia sp. Ac-20353]
MKIVVSPDKTVLGKAAADAGTAAIRASLETKGKATIVVATGTSQIDTLDALVNMTDIDWSCVDAFHLDEYIGLPASHPASFRRYLNDRFVTRLPRLRGFTAINGCTANVDAELKRLNGLLRDRTVDVCFAGIGENGHLAFNDPPADFQTDQPYLRVELDEACRRQQFDEGWFPTIEAVPREAISMSIAQIMKSQTLILSVPDLRKARAVKGAVHGGVTAMLPASIAQRHPQCTLFLDPASASGLGNAPESP